MVRLVPGSYQSQGERINRCSFYGDSWAACKQTALPIFTERLQKDISYLCMSFQPQLMGTSRLLMVLCWSNKEVLVVPWKNGLETSAPTQHHHQRRPSHQRYYITKILELGLGLHAPIRARHQPVSNVRRQQQHCALMPRGRRGWISRLKKIPRPWNLTMTYLSQYSRRRDSQKKYFPTESIFFRIYKLFFWKKIKMSRGWISRLKKITRPWNLHTTYLSRYSRRWYSQKKYFPAGSDKFLNIGL